MFAIKGESLEDYWDYTHRIFEWSDGGCPNMILDDGGDATLLIHLGLRAEGGDVAFLDKATNEEEEVLFAAIKKRLKANPGFYGRNAASIKGVTEETTTGVHRLYQMLEAGKLLVPVAERPDAGLRKTRPRRSEKPHRRTPPPAESHSRWKPRTKKSTSRQ